MIQNPTLRTTRSRAAKAQSDENGAPVARAAVKSRIGVTDRNLVKPAATKKPAGTTRSRAALGVVTGNQAPTQKEEAAGKRQRVAATKRAPTGTAVPKNPLGAKEERDAQHPLQKPGRARAPAQYEAQESRASSKQQHDPFADTQEHRQPLKENTALPQPIHVKHIMHDEEARPLPAAKRAKIVNFDNLDADDVADPMMVAEYVEDIMEYLMKCEQETMPNANYMNEQKELQWNMRSILVDWLIEVHNKFRLLPETLYLAINIIDRFLSMRVVSLVKLQLVGVTAMFIAAKYEEVVAPAIQNFVFMADGGYEEVEILKAERYILQVLDFALHYPSPMSFLRRVSKADDYDVQSRTLAKYLLEISLLDHNFLGYAPSLTAAASIWLARKMLGRGRSEDGSLWTNNLIHYSGGYTEEAVIPVARQMVEYLREDVKYEALDKKYSARKFMKVSVFARDWTKQHDAEGGDASIPAPPNFQEDVY
ncbi:cyclin-like protein [Gaertneriomyces semiglobifer]|nr:cyclin-like protein [Gaertneriomyces semiglobifer]